MSENLEGSAAARPRLDADTMMLPAMKKAEEVMAMMPGGLCCLRMYVRRLKDWQGSKAENCMCTPLASVVMVRTLVVLVMIHRYGQGQQLICRP
jgi:hypothetical protein